MSTWLTLSLIASVLTAGLAAFGGWMKWGKPLKEIMDVLNALRVALADGKITGSELATIIDEADDVWPAFKEAAK